ncbi:MAG: mechanosensitive ion channel family protein [Deltaproteobacteria bacterium]|nr:mechanosensitive ion channel family protein [Deltaproteobacteria bacterium]MBW1941708.1 mechanosensitive ion channel family protein [Deltaproteobacteria bacterium]MBW2208440.1 mechanosensitive ion channel family protein [Deltaproteobacteria bacterium]
MDGQIEKFAKLQDVMLAHGIDLILGLLLIIGGIFAIKYIMKGVRFLLIKLSVKEPVLSTTCNALYIILLAVLISAAMVEVGFDSLVIRRILIIGSLAAVALVLIIRPYIPTLPFKVGQVVKAGSLLGKVESTSLLNTRLRTFDGKIFFVPNSKIINDIVQNYHFTPTRRIKINLAIRYDQDLIKTKEIMAALMIEDPRVNVTPRPVVYVLNLSNGCVELGARCWVPNPKFWKTRCDLMEKIKLRFDAEGIVLARTQVDIHQLPDNGAEDTPGEGIEELEALSSS